MGSESWILVEVVHALPQTAFVRWISVPAGTTVAQAIERSGFYQAFPDVQVSDRNVGVFSQKVGLGHPLSGEDRVEIYRPLLLTPNEARKLRAARKGAVGTAGRVSQTAPGRKRS